LSTWGQEGVQLFFVLSGFLITGILIDAKDKPAYFSRFYRRRAQRILPAYLLMLAILRATSLIHWRFFLASLLFISNSPGAIGATNDYGSFWSLAVEEQFYLLWPQFVSRVSLRTLVRTIPLLIASSFGLQLILAMLFPRVDPHYKLWGNAAWLLAGALPAAAIRSRDLHAGNIAFWMRACFAAALATLPIVFYVDWFNTLSLWRHFLPLPFVLLSVAMVLRAVTRYASGDLQASPALSFLGYISYGLYLVHPFVFLEFDKMLPGMTVNMPRLLLSTIAVLGISTALAYASRKYFEEFFLRRRAH
jgi:peptidoglycan/LPS O-acetylase OafA/YrhL